MKFSFIDNSKPSRRRVLRDAFALALAASPLASLAKAAEETKKADETAEEVTFAAGPRPLVQYPQKRPLTLVTTRPPHLETPFPVFNEGPIPRCQDSCRLSGFSCKSISGAERDWSCRTIHLNAEPHYSRCCFPR